MALIWMEGFDGFNTAQDLSQDSTWNASTCTFVSGRFERDAIKIPPGGSVVKSLEADFGQFYMGFAVKAQAGMSSPGEIRFRDLDTAQFSIVPGAANTLRLVRNNVTLATTPTGTLPSQGWYYLEVGGVVSLTGGLMQVRLNGNVCLQVTNAVLATSGRALINNIEFRGGDHVIYDDMWFCDQRVGPGQYPCNGFQGDQQVKTVTPVNNGTPVDFSQVGGVVLGNGTAAAPQGFSDNFIYVSWSGSLNNGFRNAVSDPVSGTAPMIMCDGYVNHFEIYSQQLYPAVKIKPVIIPVDSGGIPTGPIIYGEERVGLQVGPNQLSFGGTGPLLLKDHVYCFGFMSNANLVLYTSGVQGPNGQAILRGNIGGYFDNPYSNFDWTQLNLPALALTYTLQPAGNYAQVQSYYPNGGLTYNTANVVGKKDTFGIDPQFANTAKILGVEVTGSFRIEQAGLRTASNLINSGGVFANGVAKPMSTDYQIYTDLWAVDPKTGASWTGPAVNALQIGYQVVF